MSFTQYFSLGKLKERKLEMYRDQQLLDEKLKTLPCKHIVLEYLMCTRTTLRNMNIDILNNGKYHEILSNYNKELTFQHNILKKCLNLLDKPNPCLLLITACTSSESFL